MAETTCRFDPPEADAVLERLVRWAGEREDVRAVVLTSTRTDPEAHTDIFSDYDVILAVEDVRPYFDDRAWLSDFGDLLVLYRDPVRTREGGRSFAYITQYANGLKIDFTAAETGVLAAFAATGDSAGDSAGDSGRELPADLDVGYSVLLDKDGLTEGLAAPTRTAFVPAPPTREQFATRVEEFFHEATYVAKHLWRGDLLPAKFNLDHMMKHENLRVMLDWLVETDHDWSLPTRAYGKGLQHRLPRELWDALGRSYVGAGTEENWEALFATIGLFRDVATEVGRRLGYGYPAEVDGRVCEYLQSVRELGGVDSVCEDG